MPHPVSNTNNAAGNTSKAWTRVLNFNDSSESESELPAKSLEKVQNRASHADDLSDFELEQSVSKLSDFTASKNRKRALSMSESGSAVEASKPPQYIRKGKGRQKSPRELEDKAREEMLAKGYYDAVERDRLAQSRSEQSGSLRVTPLASANPPQKRIKVEETSSPDILLTGLSVPEFYSQRFDDVRAFLLKRNYGNPTVLASLKESGFTKYELRTMKGLDQNALVTRFTSLLSDDCRRPAQLESLAFAVFSASSADWAMLNDLPIRA